MLGVGVLRRSHAGPVLPHQGGAEWAIVEVVLELPHHAGHPGQGPAANTAQQAGQHTCQAGGLPVNHGLHLGPPRQFHHQ